MQNTIQSKDLALANGTSYSAAGFKKTEGTVSFRVVNELAANIAAKRIAINPGKFDSVAEMAGYGLSADAILADGTMLTDVSANSQKEGLTIKQFLKEMLHNNFDLKKIEISTNNEETFNQIVDYADNRANRKPKEETIDLNPYVGPFQQNGKKAVIDLAVDGKVMQLNREFLLIWPFPSQSTTYISFTGDFYAPIF